ncbi:MAG: EAL and HDOD domain-containing protein [Ramlibacter sp.]
MVLSLIRRSLQRTPDVSALPTAIGPVPDAAAVPLNATGMLSYQWLLDPRKQIIGYRLAWRPVRAHAASDAAACLQALVASIAGGFIDRHKGWCMAKMGLLFDVTPQALAGLDWCGLPPKHIVLCWQAADFTQPDTLPLLRQLRSQGFGHMVSGELPAGSEAGELATHFDIGAGDAELLAASRTISKRPLLPVATRMENWPGFEACAGRRVPVLVNPDVTPPAAAARPALEPESMLIIRLLQMVQRNEDIREIEAALKHDAAITYRFLRHLNSPAVGTGIEIESLRHAVAMLGYARLFRWLSMLLATTDMKSKPAFLMKKAIIRGRFVELLGQALLGPRHTDNLFLAGMFSVIEELLGVPMAELLAKVQLGEPVQQAITDHGGIYGPFLALAQAAEAGGGEAEAIADRLCIGANNVNAAHLAAIAWSQEIGRADVAY